VKPSAVNPLEVLRCFESRNVTFMEEDGSWPIVWERARGVQVWDATGRRYLDLTAAFGVAAAGHANPRVVRAGQTQMANLLHAMGDVHPHRRKAELCRELSRITFERWTKDRSGGRTTRPGAILRGKTLLCNSGFEAVEAALKTAMLATGKPGILAFEGAYHGLGYGALNATHRDFFRSPFRRQLGGFGHFVPFPCGRRELERTLECAERLFRRRRIGAVVAEPVQGRGGIRVPPRGFLAALRRLCEEHGALLILDEVYTGFGRTGRWFACEHEPVVPDLICLGKALTGGFPLSACVGRAEVMDAAWPASTGEALHTSTFLGHPVGCAMALAQIGEIRRWRLVERSARMGAALLDRLRSLRVPPATFCLQARGLGLMVGLELRASDGSPLTDLTLRVVKQMLHRGFILLPEGEEGNVIGFTPPLTISRRQVEAVVEELDEVLVSEARGLPVRRRKRGGRRISRGGSP
jgi:4-aminobutyrate aminotransferase-like enzyme